MQQRKDKNGTLRFQSQTCGDSKICKIYGVDGKLVKIVNYMKGKKHGPTNYYKNDVLDYSDNYENGKLKSTIQIYSIDNVMFYQTIQFLDFDNLYVCRKEYDIEAQICISQKSYTISKQNLLSGNFRGIEIKRIETKNNQIHEFAEIDNKINGTYNIYENEILICCKRYCSGVLHGSCIDYKEDRVYNRCFEYGKLVYVNVSQNNRVLHIRNLVDGKIMGMQEDYYTNGNCKKRYNILSDTIQSEEFDEYGNRIV